MKLSELIIKLMALQQIIQQRVDVPLDPEVMVDALDYGVLVKTQYCMRSGFVELVGDTRA